MKYTICAIIKDEQRYLEEWIIHNLSIGFTDIHLYEDDNSESHKCITDKYENVYLHSFSEVEIIDKCKAWKQLNLFNHFIKKYKLKYDWCAFIDPDEFIRFNENYNLYKLCNEFKEYNGIMLWWKVYGANNHIKRPVGLLQENYTINPQEPHVLKVGMKTIVNLNKHNIIFKSPHRIKNGVFTNFVNKLTDKVYYKKAWIDHYFTKSLEDWIERFTKRGDVVLNNRKIEQFFIYNKDMNVNDIKNEFKNNNIEI